MAHFIFISDILSGMQIRGPLVHSILISGVLTSSSFFSPSVLAIILVGGCAAIFVMDDTGSLCVRPEDPPTRLLFGFGRQVSVKCLADGRLGANLFVHLKIDFMAYFCPNSFLTHS